MCDEWLNNPEKFITWAENHGWEKGTSLSLDRIDLNDNYSPENCRWTTNTVQAINRRLYINSRTGFKGVTIKGNDRYRARITVNGTVIDLGTYKNIDDAIEARRIAEEDYFGKNACMIHSLASNIPRLK